jgi:DNA-binding NarL/FixJ family response regulator
VRFVIAPVEIAVTIGAMAVPIPAPRVEPCMEQGFVPDGVSGVETYRVIVADDAVGMRELMHTLLSLEPDFEVVGQARDGVEAVELVTELQPDLVVIDISMPVMDGLEAIERIRAISPSTRVAVLSAERRLAPTGADTDIEKGTPNEVLVATLRTLCQTAPQAGVR